MFGVIQFSCLPAVTAQTGNAVIGNYVHVCYGIPPFTETVLFVTILQMHSRLLTLPVKHLCLKASARDLCLACVCYGYILAAERGKSMYWNV